MPCGLHNLHVCRPAALRTSPILVSSLFHPLPTCQVLIFSQFIGMLDMVQEFLSLRGHKHERLDGRTTGNERQKSIDR